jgi:serpin B
MKQTAIILLAIIVAACTPAEQLPEAIPQIQPLDMEINSSNASPEAINAVVDGINQFAFELYSELEEEENILFSPYSIAAALAMTYEGARGSTAKEMQQVLHFPAEANLRQSGFAALISSLNSGSSLYELQTANALFPDEGYAFEEEFIRIIAAYYGGELYKTDYKNDPEGSRQAINRWVKASTQGIIEELFSKGSIKEITRLVLANAIYFKGTWEYEFSLNETREAEFRQKDNSVKPVQMMARTDDSFFKYAEAEGVQAIELDYDGGRVSMFIILPEDLNSFRLSSNAFNELYSSLKPQSVKVHLPRFRLEAQSQLNELLPRMGMPLAFTHAADFSRMDPSNMLMIDNVIHKAAVEVGEEGTIAAAATGVEMVLKSLPTARQFYADSPFLFFILDKQAGAILFMGRLDKP